MATKMLSTTIDAELALKLDKIALETQRKKSYFVNQALKDYFEEIEDFEIAMQRQNGDSVTIEQAKRELNL